MKALRPFVLATALVSAALVTVGCGRSTRSTTGSSTPDKVANVGETVSFEDSDWIVLSAKNLGSKIKPANLFGEEKTTAGQFIEVRYTVTNKQSQQDSIVEGPKLIDSKGRQFDPLPDEALVLATGRKNIVLVPLPPSMTKEFWTVFEVPADATGLQFQARSLGALPSFKPVFLGALPPPAPSTSPSVAGVGAAEHAHPSAAKRR